MEGWQIPSNACITCTCHGIWGQVGVPREEGPTSASKYGPCEWWPHCSGQGIETCTVGGRQEGQMEHDPPQKPLPRKSQACFLQETPQQ